MADTSFIKRVVEPYVREVLAQRHGMPFALRFLELRTGGRHEFDAVSEDGRIVASIKSASGLTAGGRSPAGKIKDSLAELYYLSLTEAETRVLVLTTPAFYEIFMRKVDGALAEGLLVECIPLPADLQESLDQIVEIASREVSPATAQRAIAAEVEAEATDR